jgi:hypothetical protein
MKKKIIVLAILSLGFAGIVVDKDEANTKSVFKVVGVSDKDNMNAVYEVVHKKTGCHYLISDFNNGNMIQMWAPGGNGGVGKPYCEEVK